jgi:hypothetical protein
MHQNENPLLVRHTLCTADSSAIYKRKRKSVIVFNFLEIKRKKNFAVTCILAMTIQRNINGLINFLYRASIHSAASSSCNYDFAQNKKLLHLMNKKFSTTKTAVIIEKQSSICMKFQIVQITLLTN